MRLSASSFITSCLFVWSSANWRERKTTSSLPRDFTVLCCTSKAKLQPHSSSICFLFSNVCLSLSVYFCSRSTSLSQRTLQASNINLDPSEHSFFCGCYPVCILSSGFSFVCGCYPVSILICIFRFYSGGHSSAPALFQASFIGCNLFFGLLKAAVASFGWDTLPWWTTDLLV
jgi:hypothetical protein